MKFRKIYKSYYYIVHQILTFILSQFLLTISIYLKLSNTINNPLLTILSFLNNLFKISSLKNQIVSSFIAQK